MSLKAQLQQELTDALKARNELKVSVLRSVIGAVQSAEKAGKSAVEFDDEHVLQVIRKQVKQRKESVEIYSKAGEVKRAGRELAEAKVLESYLPKTLTEDEVRAIVREELDKLENVTPASFGQLMKASMARVAGRADGKLVSQLVKDALTA